jgi:two-component system, response regulator PdtaR
MPTHHDIVHSWANGRGRKMRQRRPSPGRREVSEALRIVIAADNSLIAMDLADLLIAMGHDVCALASTEAQTIAAADLYAPGLMIVDGELAQGSGVSAMKDILSRRFVPHLYITGNPLDILDLHPDAVVISKPFTMRDLNVAIAKALGRQELS